MFYPGWFGTRTLVEEVIYVTSFFLSSPFVPAKSEGRSMDGPLDHVYTGAGLWWIRSMVFGALPLYMWAVNQGITSMLEWSLGSTVWNGTKTGVRSTKQKASQSAVPLPAEGDWIWNVHLYSFMSSTWEINSISVYPYNFFVYVYIYFSLFKPTQKTSANIEQRSSRQPWSVRSSHFWNDLIRRWTSWATLISFKALLEEGWWWGLFSSERIQVEVVKPRSTINSMYNRSQAINRLLCGMAHFGMPFILRSQRVLHFANPMSKDEWTQGIASKVLMLVAMACPIEVAEVGRSVVVDLSVGSVFAFKPTKVMPIYSYMLYLSSNMDEGYRIAYLTWS